MLRSNGFRHFVLSQTNRAPTWRNRRLSSLPSGISPPLRGIKVLDLTRVLAGPLCTQLLADLGADVVKVEERTRGDDTRTWSPPSAPLSDHAEASHLPAESAYFLALNRNKRSVTVDFKKQRGLEILHRMVEQADVLVENFIPGKLTSLGLGWEECSKINPRLIYTSITGYGQTGPYSKAPGYDVVIEAEAGLMHITGEAHGQPCKVGVAVTDVSTGLYAHGAVMAALISRQQTGKGVWIDCNLLETQVAGLVNIASSFLLAGIEASRHGTAHPSIAPYEVFECKDGFIMIGAGNDKQFTILADKILCIPELANDHRFSSNSNRVANRELLKKIITEVLLNHERDYWLDKFTGLGIPFGPINNINETFLHPQILARNMVQTIQHPRAGSIKLVSPAVTYNGKRMPISKPPPWLSEHTDEVLDELGYSRDEIYQLRRDCII